MRDPLVFAPNVDVLKIIYYLDCINKLNEKDKLLFLLALIFSSDELQGTASFENNVLCPKGASINNV
ncbi:unnamed protein product [Rotaria sp. Silwood1]|nr:unnamed protein product [Rotaria sp. Silwood1]